MNLKKGTFFDGIRPELLLAVMVAQHVYYLEGYRFRLTSGREGKHSKTSLHYAGMAVDIGIIGVRNPQRLVELIKEALGFHPDYDVVLEKDHIHLEWQPKLRE